MVHESLRPGKRVGGIGRGMGRRRLTLESDLALSVLAYARTADGFVTSLHQTAPKWKTLNGGGALVEFFNPGSNRAIASVLRIINLEDREFEVRLYGHDDRDGSREYPEVADQGAQVRFNLGPNEARNFTSWELEEGPEDAQGRLVDGQGKWTLVVEAQGEIGAQREPPSASQGPRWVSPRYRLRRCRGPP